MARNATIMATMINYLWLAMKTTITMMERWFITTILRDKEFGEDDDMKTATMMLMLMLVMLMLMMSIFLCGCRSLPIPTAQQRMLNPATTDDYTATTCDKPRNNG